MKTISFLLLLTAGWLAVIFSTLAQTGPVRSVTLRGPYTLEEALDRYADATGLDYSFSPDRFTPKKVELDIRNLSTTQALDVLGKAYDFSARIQEGQVVLRPKQTPPRKPKRPTSNLRGRIRDDAGKRVAYATVALPELGLSTISDTAGLFALEIPLPEVRTRVLIKAEGYPDRSLPVHIRQQTVLNVNVQGKPAKPDAPAATRKQRKADTRTRLVGSFRTGKVPSVGGNPEIRFDSSAGRLPVLVSLLPGLESSRMVPTSSKPAFMLNLIGGTTPGLEGFAVAGVMNQVQYKGDGFMAAGALNQVGGPFDGFLAAGATNMVSGNMDGFLAAGAANVASGKVDGFMAAGAVNVAQEIDGFAASGALNLANVADGFQATGGVNLTAAGDGFSVAGGANLALDEHSGVQIAPLNYARHLSGLQIGVVNLVDSSDGFSFGVINLVPRGRHALQAGLNANGLATLQYENGNRCYAWTYGLALPVRQPYPVTGALAGLGLRVWPWSGSQDKTFYLPRIGLTAWSPIHRNHAGENLLASGELEFRLPIGERVQIGASAQFWYCTSLGEPEGENRPLPSLSREVIWQNNAQNRAWVTAGLSVAYVLRRG